MEGDLKSILLCSPGELSLTNSETEVTDPFLVSTPSPGCFPRPHKPKLSDQNNGSFQISSVSALPLLLNLWCKLSHIHKSSDHFPFRCTSCTLDRGSNRVKLSGCLDAELQEINMKLSKGVEVGAESGLNMIFKQEYHGCLDEIRYLAHPGVKLRVYDKETECNGFHFPFILHMYSSSTLSCPVLYCLVVKLHISTLSSSWVYFFLSLPSSCFLVNVWGPNQFNSRPKYRSCTFKMKAA